MTQINKQIAGVLFTDNGIMIERKYQYDPEFKSNIPRIPEEKFSGEFLEIAKRLVKYRMADCYVKFHSNLANAQIITKESIIWKSGHFEITVWEQMEAVLSLDDVRKLNALQCQQIVRSMMFNAPTYWLGNHDDSWVISKDSETVRLTDEFKMFITEQFLCTKMNPVL